MATCGGSEAQQLKGEERREAWHKRVEGATNLDSVLHSIVTNALQAASQWAPEAAEVGIDSGRLLGLDSSDSSGHMQHVFKTWTLRAVGRRLAWGRSLQRRAVFGIRAQKSHEMTLQFD